MLKLEVLSGGLSGRTFQFDETQVRLGRHPACEVVFDAMRDDSVGRWHAHVRPEGNAWSIENLNENGTFLNGKPVTGKLMIQSGDSIRLARDGPEIRVTIVPREVPSEPPPVKQDVVLPLPPSRAVLEPMLPTHASKSRSSLNAWLGVSAVGIAVVALLAVLLSPRFSGNRDKRNSHSEAERPVPRDADSQTSTVLPGKDEATSGATAVRTPPSGKDPEPSEPWKMVEQRNRRAVFAVAAEEPNGVGMWPMGTACAVRADMLVTTASVATQLETLRRDGWRIWALGSESNSAKEIATIQVHIGFVKSAEKPEHQAFFDLALITLSGRVAEVCQIASDEEIDALDARQPFGCLAISLPVDDPSDPPEPIGRFDVLVPELTKGKIQGLLQLSRDPSAPRMLLLPASMPTHIWGSPVLNASGNIVAVCTEAAQKTETGPVRLNYAPLLKGVSDWLKGKGQELWVAPPTGIESHKP